MEWYLILAIVIAYFIIGGITNGIIASIWVDYDNSSIGMPLFTFLFWPLILVGAVICMPTLLAFKISELIQNFIKRRLKKL